MFAKNKDLLNHKTTTVNQIGRGKVKEYYSTALNVIRMDITHKEKTERLQEIIDYLVYDFESVRFKENSKNKSFFKTLNSLNEKVKPFKAVDTTKLQEHAL